MSTSLFVILCSFVVATAALSAALSVPRRGSWVAAALVAALGVAALWLLGDEIATAGEFGSNSVAVQLAALVTLIFVPLIAVQYMRETLARRPSPPPTPHLVHKREDIIIPAERLHPSPATAVAAEVPPLSGQPTAESRLRAAQAHFRDFAEHSRVGMWVQDAKSGELVYLSPGFEAIWGCAAETLYAAPHKRVEAIHCEDRARVGEALMRAIAGHDFAEEYRVERPDGSIRWVWDLAVPVRDAHGNVLRLTGMAEDITQRKGIEEVNLFRANFVANMSHEVRTPLNIMIGYLEFLLDGTFGELTQQQREITERVRKNAEELLALMSASLDLSRLDNRTIPLAIEAVVVAELLGEVVGDLSKVSANQDVAMRVQIADDLALLHSDRQKIKMILKNLISNAVKFTAQGEIVVGARPVAVGVELSVRDTGAGIPHETLPRVFDPFRQGEHPGSAKAGVGLGLYIVRRLVDILEGRISVESTLGQGTTFRVWLPLSLANERDGNEESAGSTPAKVTSSEELL